MGPKICGNQRARKKEESSEVRAVLLNNRELNFGHLVASRLQRHTTIGSRLNILCHVLSVHPNYERGRGAMRDPHVERLVRSVSSHGTLGFR